MKRRHDQRAGEKGVILIAALVAMVIVAGLAAAMFGTARAEMSQSRNYRNKHRALNLAEAATATARAGISSVDRRMRMDGIGNETRSACLY